VVLRLIPLAGQLPFVDHGVLDAAATRLRELADPPTAGGEVMLHGDFYLGNVLVCDGHVSALIDFEFSRMGPPDLELISLVRALDAERRLGLQRPPLLAWLAEDYPELFGTPDLHTRLWRYALASPSARSSSGHPIAPRPMAWTQVIRCTPCGACSTPRYRSQGTYR
jgi:hypothetical protein